MIHLRENVPSTWELKNEDLAYLLSVVDSSPEETVEAKVLKAILPTRRVGFWQLTAGSFVGRLGLPSGGWIDFQSRFDFPDVMRLIQFGLQDPRLVNRYRVPSQPGLLLADALAAAFSDAVGHLVGQGLSKAYRRERQTKPPYGGRVDVAYHLSRFAGRPDVLVTQRRHLTVDIGINQALASALEVLHRVPLTPWISKTLARLRPAFARVSRPALRGSDVARMQLQGEAIRYRRALLLAEVVLRSQHLLPVGSSAEGASILFFMPDVWEKYVAHWVATLDVEGAVESPYPFSLSREGRTAEADVVITERGRVKALFDAKYKPSESAPSSPDIYQMVTYCEALGLSEATLVYPGFVKDKTVTVQGKSVRVKGLALDLSDVKSLSERVA